MFGSGNKLISCTLADRPSSLSNLSVRMKYLTKFTTLSVTVYDKAFEKMLVSLLQQSGINVNKVPKSIMKEFVNRFRKSFMDTQLVVETQQYNAYMQQCGCKVTEAQREQIMKNLADSWFNKCVNVVTHDYSFVNAINMLRPYYAA